MKKYLFPFIIFLISNYTIIAQNHHKELVDKIAEKHIWLYAEAVQNTATLNLSESMWEMVLGGKMHPKGYSTMKRMGKAFVDLSDKFGETYLEKNVALVSVHTVDEKDNRAGCKEVIDSWNGKYFLTVNAPKVEASRAAFKMVFGYVSSVAIYLEDGSASIWHHGYVPSSAKLHIIINADNTYKTVEVSWNKEKNTVTINAPADIETVGWDGKIEKGLISGWKSA